MDNFASIMQSISQAIQFLVGCLRTASLNVCKLWARPLTLTDFVVLWVVCVVLLLVLVWTLVSEDKSHARYEKTSHELRVRNQQLAAQIAQTNQIYGNDTATDDDDDDNDDDYTSSAVDTDNDNEVKSRVTIHRTVINFSAPMTDVHFHSFGHGSEATQERLFPTMAGYGTHRLLAADDDCDEEDEDEEDEEIEEESDEE